MFRLARMIYSVLAVTLAGVGVVIMLVLGFGNLVPLLSGAVVGAIVAAPLSWLIAQAIYDA